MIEKPDFDKMKRVLRERHVKGKQVYMDEATIEQVKEYARKTEMSDSQVINEMILRGSQEFEKRHGLGMHVEEKKEEAKSEDSEKDRGQQLSEAYGKRILRDGWTSEGQRGNEYQWQEQG